MADRVGQQLGNYRLIQLLGQGTFAEVYLGQHLHLDTQAAIKMLHAHLSSQDIESFRREAHTIAHLVHPHIIRVLDFGVEDGLPFLVMDYAPGGSLRKLHPKGERLALETVLCYVKQVAAALQYTHDQKLIHRDLKPANLLLGRNHEILLSDFGLALLEHSFRQQQTLQTAGTIAYMAPEQLSGHPRSASDQYALGVVVHEWLCGERPFSGSFLEVAHQHTSVLPPSLREKIPTLPLAVEQVVLSALAKDPELRFASVQAFALALEEACGGDLSGQTLPVLASGDPAEAGRGAASIPHLPRGTVTLLFTDMEGSTSLLQQLGERYTQVLGECRRLLRAAFHQWHGHEVDTQGDSFLAAFARATDALAATVDAQRALARHAWPDGVSVRVRMGVHTGEPQLSAEGYVGLDVHRAARIMNAGHGGQVLLSQTTRALVEHDLPEGVSLRDLGEHRLKDLQQKSHLFQLVIADLPADFPPLKTLDTHPHNLPVQPSPLIGRQKEAALVQHLLRREEVRLLVLTGPGGTGKTRLGLQVAAELSDLFLDGVFFVDLAPLSDPSLVVPTIAQTLGIREVAGQPLLERLLEELRQKQLLLLLDNFEQVLSAAVQVSDLLAACPKLKVLVTSREVLHVRAEQEFAVPPLALPDPKQLPDLATLAQTEAVALFLQRTQAVKPAFQLTAANARAVAEICVRLDGLPLAIELAAARGKLLPPQALLTRLSQRLAVLTAGTRDLPARQQTLRSTIAWSYDLLNAAEQQLFQRLSVFAGGCSLEAAEAICAGGDGVAVPVLEGVTSLIDKSLLQPIEQAGEEPRLVMLETIREYGVERLAAHGEREETWQAHAEYYLALAEKAELELGGPQQVAWLQRLEREHDNLRAAMRWTLERWEIWHHMEMGLRLGGALWRFWRMRCHFNEGQHFLQRALAGSEGAHPSIRAKALNAAGDLALDQYDLAQAEVLCGQSLLLYRELGEKRGIATSLYMLGIVAHLRSQYEVARSLYEESLALFKEVGDQGGIAWVLSRFADLAFAQGDYIRSYALIEESLAHLKELGDKWSIGYILLQVVTIASYRGEYAKTHALAEESLAIYRELGDKEGTAQALHQWGGVFLNQGDYARAGSLLQEGLAIYRELGARRGVAGALFSLGRVALGQGDYATAQVLHQESLTMFKELDNKWLMALGLEELAAVVALQGHPTWAARLVGAAAALREAAGSPPEPMERTNYERGIGYARNQLGEKTFAKALAEGRTMTLEQALAAQEPVPLPTPTRAEPRSAPPVKPSVTYPDGLTAREVEVLRLVANGLSNIQVSERLVISPRTVDTHLTAIYGKIGVSSRVAATRYAIEHHLI